ncbi:MAG: hypothetical protein H6582_02615 [Crocinitomicaceae bacterium]|nr:hypothetical protein [Crocinitomicaceae bacterium]
MNRDLVNQRLEQNRYVIYQLSFMVLFGLIFPFLLKDAPSLISEPRQIVHLGIMALLAIFADLFGSLIKARELNQIYSSNPQKAVGWFFVIFWIFRAAVIMFGGMIAIIGLTGATTDEPNPVGMTIAIFESFRWLIMGFVIYQMIAEGRSVKLTRKKKMIGDILIMYSSAFYLSVIWMTINFSRTPWADMTNSGKREYVIAGFVLFLMIYVPATFYNFLENLIRSKTRKEKWQFWLGIVVTGAIALAYPMIL